MAKITYPGAVDTHAHVCGPEARYPYWPGRIYTPADASPEDYRAMLDSLGVERGVLVQPSVYATDNRRMMDALALDPERLRGVAVLPWDTSLREIEKLHAAGVRGIRVNIVDIKENKGALPLRELESLAARVQPLGWHVEFLMHVDEFPDLEEQLASFPVDTVFGHLGYVSSRKSIEEPGFQGLIALMKKGKAWVKMTAPYRLTLSAMPYPDTDKFAHALVAAAPERLLWGSDWPHVHIKTAMPRDEDLLALFRRWVGDEALQRKILVENPAQLYNFPAIQSAM